ncbi:MAG TPA: efflux RND transporter periplasmic adaptor subunit, partial [Gammaproteobacteria bacterium]|nr:efflux RND transporter periplasmic adaptor subunit [Gammaproteobacteria bacterium]
KMIARIVLVLVALAALFGGIFGWKYKQIQDSMSRQGPPPPATVAAAEVTTEVWDRYLVSVGSLVASRGVYVTTEVAGQVETISFDSGQAVASGVPLVQLDASVDQADLAGLVAEAKLAEVEFRRGEDLLEKRNISRAEYDRLQAQLAFARAQVAAKRAQINEKTIRAPFDGWLGIRQVDVGEYLAPGARIVLLQDLSPIYVDYTLPERYVDLLSPGLSVEVTVQGYGEEIFHGRVSALDPGVDPGTRALRIRATLDNPTGRLRPGMFAEVKTLVGESRGVMTLPRTAIAFAPYGDTVFKIVDENGQPTVQRIPVKTGEDRDDRVQILDGLASGDRVVNAGQLKLRNGQTIQIDNSVALDGKVSAP